jgi:hypothetical protein
LVKVFGLIALKIYKRTKQSLNMSLPELSDATIYGMAAASYFLLNVVGYLQVKEIHRNRQNNGGTQEEGPIYTSRIDRILNVGEMIANRRFGPRSR